MSQRHPPTCSTFIHIKLKDPQKDIRLFKLLTESIEEHIKLEIFHTALPAPKVKRRDLRRQI